MSIKAFVATIFGVGVVIPLVLLVFGGSPKAELQHSADIQPYLYSIFGSSPASEVKDAVICSVTGSYPGFAVASLDRNSRCDLLDEHVVVVENPVGLAVGESTKLLKKHTEEQWVAIPQS